MVAGKAEDGELVRVLRDYGFVEGFEGGELGGEAAFGGGVDDQDDFAFEGGEGIGLTFFYRGWVSEERRLGYFIEGMEDRVQAYCLRA